MKAIIKDILPPIVLRSLKSIKNYAKRMAPAKKIRKNPDVQELDVYWDEKMANMLETWGVGNVWNEIQFLMLNCNGRILDLACGTGKTMEILSKYPFLDIQGCDISDFLISKAVERGLARESLKVCDATATGYEDLSFDYAYSIGSLEHFTEDCIGKFILENYRVAKKNTFHFVPVSKSGTYEGWVVNFQSYFNNSTAWWLNKFGVVYGTVYVLDSVWCDNISDGKWFICIKD